MVEAQEGTEPGTAAPDEPAETTDKPKAGAQQSAGARLAARRAAKAAKKAAKRGTETTAEEEVADELEQTAAQASSWLDENKTKLLGLLGAVIAVGGAVVAITSHNRNVGSEGAAQLYAGVEAALAPIAAEGAEVEDAADLTTYPNEEARAKEAVAAFRKTRADFPGTPAAAWARLGEANGLRELGKADEALAAYGELSSAEDLALRHYALMGAGTVLEGQGKHADAKQKFEAAGGVDGERYKPPADYHAARMLVAMGQQDEAIKRLKQLVEIIGTLGIEGPNYAGIKNQADTLLAELGAAPAPSPAGGAPDSAALQKLLQQLNLGDKGVAK